MKHLINFLIESLKINKNTKINEPIQTEIKNSNFSEEEIEDINIYAQYLPIKPDLISNRRRFDKKASTESWAKDKMYLHYYRNKDKKGGYHTNNFISINKFAGGETHWVTITQIDKRGAESYPDLRNEKSFVSMKECFNAIKKHWDELGVSESINKYK